MLFFYLSGEARYVYTNDQRTHTHGDGGSRRTDPDAELFPCWWRRSEARHSLGASLARPGPAQPGATRF